MATLEEVQRCYKCDQTGEEVSVQPAKERYQGMVHVMECKNKLCKNFEQRWIFQVKPDGTIPDARSKLERPGGGSFPEMSEGTQAQARRTLEDLQREERNQT